MKTISMNINYGGTQVKVRLYTDQDCRGIIYPVEMDGNYSFTLFCNEEEEWDIMREGNGITPHVENELFGIIVKKLEYQLRYAA